MIKGLSIFGTTSDSGKSSITLALCRILKDLGYSVSPFKAQNMSNNSAVCDDGSEIGRAQYLQAEVINLYTSYHLNPILLKPQGDGLSQLIINGKVYDNIYVKDYYRIIDKLKPYVIDCYEYLANKSQLIIAEGAGSPVELNLTSRDLSNNFVAEYFNTHVIIVADIERGGVFASIYGSYNLLPNKIKNNVIGVIINKFRGDISLFKEGIRIIEEEFKLPVLGVIPYINFNVDMEDSLSINNYEQNTKCDKIKIGVIKFPNISNYNDIDPIIADPEVQVDFIKDNRSLYNYDLLLLPGTKTTIKDLQWLKSKGLFDKINNFNKTIFAICGGYQMLFRAIDDFYGIENSHSAYEEGFNFINDKVIFKKEKILNRGIYNLFNMKLSGYEIRCGYTKSYDLYFNSGKIYGTHVHGIFENDNFRTSLFKLINPLYKGYSSYKKYKSSLIKEFTNSIKENIKIEKIINLIK